MTHLSDAVVARLRDAGVRCLFGMPGGGSNLDLVDACGRAGLPFVLTATETGGALAALAQAEITGRPGACLTTLGPGVASVVNGVACARLERAPLIVFTDAPAAGTAFEHQRLDHRALLAPVTKWSATIAADNAAVVMEQAIASAMSHPRGPVHIDCPGDALASGTGEARGLQPSGGGADERSPERLAVPRSKKPLLLLGLGARDAQATAAIRALCASRRVPAMVTYKAKGVVADTDLWFAGVFTNGAVERPIIEEADLLVAIGLDAVELLPRPFTHAQPLVHIAAADVTALENTLAVSSWDLAGVQRMVARQREALCVRSDGLAPHRVVQVAAEAAPHARVAVDAGAHMFPATMLWPIDEPNGMLISNGLSTMGFALPAAIGAALIDKGRPVVALTGDGGLLMCAGELVTAAREGLHVIVVVFNDETLSLIDIKQRQRSLARSGVDIGFVDWCALAAGAGVRGQSASTSGELAGTLAAALRHHGPSLIDVRVDPSGYAATLKAVRG